MMILYRSKFLEAHYLELQHLMHLRYTEYAAYMDAEGVYHEMLNFFSGRIHKRARAVMLDLRSVDMLADAEFEKWFLQHILPKIASFNARLMVFVTGHKPDDSIPEELQLFSTGSIAIRHAQTPSQAMALVSEKLKPEG